MNPAQARKSLARAMELKDSRALQLHAYALSEAQTIALVSIAEDASLVVHALQDIANTLSTLCAIDPRYQAAVASLEAGTAGGAT